MKVAQRISFTSDACVTSWVCKPDPACTNVSTERRESAGRTTKKTGDANIHLSPWTIKACTAQEAEEWFLEKDSESLVERLEAQRSRQLKAERPWRRGKSAVRQRSGFYFSHSQQSRTARKKKTACQKNFTQRLTFRDKRSRPKPRAPLRGERWA